MILRAWGVPALAAAFFAFGLATTVDAQCDPPGRPNGGGSSGGSNNPQPPSPNTPSPSSPSTPGPSNPSTPGPQTPGPSTPGATPGGGLAPLTGGGRAPGGIPLVFTRGKSSKKRLKIQWDYPVPEVGEQPLPAEFAFRRIRGDDERPMIVMRECGWCAGSDDALLSRSLDNEKTLILTRWFHCVKLPNHVLQDTHPFHKLFDGDDPPHLVLVSADGETKMPFDGRQAQSELWKDMFAMLKADYAKQPEPVVKSLLRLLDRFDYLDSKEEELKAQLDDAIVAAGPTSSRAKRLIQKLNELQKDKKATLAEEEKLAELDLKADD